MVEDALLDIIHPISMLLSLFSPIVWVIWRLAGGYALPIGVRTAVWKWELVVLATVFTFSLLPILTGDFCERMWDEEIAANLTEEDSFNCASLAFFAAASAVSSFWTLGLILGFKRSLLRV